MNAKMRRQAELARRVSEFSLAHPSDDPAYAGLLQRITETSERARALAATQGSGMTKSKGITGQLVEVRKVLVGELLAHVERAVTAATRAGVALKGEYVKSKEYTPLMTISINARKALDGVTQDLAALQPHGLSADVVPMLTASLTRFDALIAERDASRNAHVGATFALKEVLKEIREVTLSLDSFNRLRFGRQSADLAEWKRTRQLIGAPRATGTTPTQEPDVTPAA